ncbi:hypothetical protein RUND412_010308 [Rhizina undulata]
MSGDAPPPNNSEKIPSEPSTSADKEDAHTRLAHLKAAALKAYSLKDYTLSTDIYSQACEIQATLSADGDNDPRNAGLLYLYGRSIFQVAVRKSDVLGDVPDDPAKSSKPKSEKSKNSKSGPSSSEAVPKGGVFSFQGDENWGTDSEDEGDDEDDEEKEGEDDSDDFLHAWEVLESSRVLYLDLLADDYTPSLTPEEKNTAETSLSDVYDLLGEVSLESENFEQAAKDFRSSLEIKQRLYEFHSAVVTEAHFKLSLALEFAATGEGLPAETVNEWRDEAASQMEKAIKSCKARIAKEEAEAAADGEGKGKGKGKEKEVLSKSLKEAREMVKELELRLVDLRAPPPELEGGLDQEVISGLLGQVLGGDPKKLQEAMAQANDVSNLVRKKPQKKENGETKEGEKNGKEKRKLENVVAKDEAEEEEDVNGQGKESKKMRMEEVTDESMRA